MRVAQPLPHAKVRKTRDGDSRACTSRDNHPRRIRSTVRRLRLCHESRQAKRQRDGAAHDVRVYIPVAKKIPVRSIAEYMNEKYGTAICAATVDNALKVIAEMMAPESEEIRIETTGADVCTHIDETEMSVDGDKWHVWAATAKDAACFVVSLSRGAVTLDTHFPGLSGPCITDGYVVYKRLEKRQHCWPIFCARASFWPKTTDCAFCTAG